MIWGVLIFLVVIGLLVFVSTIGSRDNFFDNDTLNEDNTEKNDPGNEIIDFRTSSSIPHDLERLKAKLNNEIKVRRDTRRILIGIIIISFIILIGVSFFIPYYILTADKVINNKDNVKTDIYEPVDKDDKENKDNEKENYSFEILTLSEKDLYEGTTLSPNLLTSDDLLKDFNVHKDKIVSNEIEFIIKTKGLTMKFNSYDDLNKYFISEDRKENFEKRFLLSVDGVLIKYIYTVK